MMPYRTPRQQREREARLKRAAVVAALTCREWAKGGQNWSGEELHAIVSRLSGGDEELMMMALCVIQASMNQVAPL